MNKIKILVNSHLFPNKLEPALATFVKGCVDSVSKYVDINVISPLPKTVNKIDTLDNSYGYEVYRPKYEAEMYDFPKNSVEARKQLESYLDIILDTIKNKKFNIIHSHFIFPDGYIGAKLKRKLNIPLIISLHGAESFDRKEQTPLWKEMDYGLQNADKIICPHPEMVDLCLKHRISASKIIQIPYPIDTKKFNPRTDSSSFLKKYNLNKKDFKVIFVGRFAKMKDPITLIRAIPLILKKVNNIHFIFVGDDDPSLNPLKRIMEKIIKSKGIEKYVTFTGFIGNVHGALSASDIFVSMNTYDNIWTMSPLEAMASGKATILTDEGYTRKFLPHKKKTFLIKSKSPEDTAKGIVELISNKELRKKLERSGRELIEQNFTMEKIGKKTYNLYKKVIS